MLKRVNGICNDITISKDNYLNKYIYIIYS